MVFSLWKWLNIFFVMYTCTVESSLFVRDQCSWVIFAHEFTSPRTFNKVINCSTLLCYKPVTHEITSPRTSKTLTIHEHWPPWISMIPHEHRNGSYYKGLRIYWIFIYFHVKHFKGDGLLWPFLDYIDPLNIKSSCIEI